MESALPQNASSMNDVDARTNTSFPKITTPNDRAAVPRKTRLATAENPRAHSTKLRFFENRTSTFNRHSPSRAHYRQSMPLLVPLLEETQIGFGSGAPTMLPGERHVRTEVSVRTV